MDDMFNTVSADGLIGTDISALGRSSHAYAPDNAALKPSFNNAQDLYDWVSADPLLADQQRANELSALRALEKPTHLPLAATPLGTKYLTEEVFALKHQEADVTKRRWSEIRSICGRILKRAGILAITVRRNNALTIAWQLRLDELEHFKKTRLSGFARFCSKRSIEPGAVTEMTFVEFDEEELTKSAKGKKAYKTGRMARTTWNWAVENMPGWTRPKVEVPNYANRYGLPKSSFRVELAADIDRYADACRRKKGHVNPFGVLNKKACRRLSDKTIELHRELIWAMAAIQVRRGRPIAEIDGLEALVDPVWVNQGLFFLWERYGENTKRLHSFAGTMHSIAKSFVRPKKKVLDALASLCKTAWPDAEPGFSDKNLKMLLQFDSPQLFQSLYMLPYVIAGAIKLQKAITRDDAWAVMIALAIELELTSMVRLGNLAEIDMKKNVWPVGVDGDRLLVFPGIKVKNGQPLQFTLSPQTWELWDFYVEKCRPLLVNGASTLLFPIEADTKKREARIRYHITFTVYRRLKIWVTPHQYRHIGVMVYLKQHPEDYYTPSMALGHKGEETLKKHYAYMSQHQAVKQFTAVVLAGREELIAGFGF